MYVAITSPYLRDWGVTTSHCIMNPPRFRCVLWSLLPALTWNNRFQEKKPVKELIWIWESRRESKLFWKKSWNQEYQRFKRWIPKRRTINSNWTEYHNMNSICILQCNYILFSSYWYELGLLTNIKSQKSTSQVENQALVPKKPCHAPLPKIHGNEVATKVGDVYTRRKYPTYTR